MNTARHAASWLGLCFAALMVVACANRQMEAAQQSLAGIDTAIKALPTDANKYLPDQVSNVNQRRAHLQEAFNMADYEAVVSGAPEVLILAQSLGGDAARKKDEVLKEQGVEWAALNTQVPDNMAALKARVSALSRSGHVPRGEDIGSAKTGLDNATAHWETAQSYFKAGNFEQSVTEGRSVEATLETAASAVKFKLPDAAK